MSSDPKTLFLKRVVKRGGVKKGVRGRFRCGHLSRLTKAHLVPGEFFPYGASGAALLACVVCEATAVSFRMMLLLATYLRDLPKNV